MKIKKTPIISAFPSNKTPPTILKLKPSEEDVLKRLENIKFRDTKNHFQENLANNLKRGYSP